MLGDFTMVAKTKQNSHIVPRPTAAELGILRVLWAHGPCTVRRVHEMLCEHDKTGYTTVLKFLQIMHRKGLVRRDAAQRAHVYEASATRDETQRRMTNHFIENVFDGSYSQLVLQALGDSAKATPEELAQMRQLLSRLEGERS